MSDGGNFRGPAGRTVPGAGGGGGVGGVGVLQNSNRPPVAPRPALLKPTSGVTTPQGNLKKDNKKIDTARPQGAVAGVGAPQGGGGAAGKGAASKTLASSSSSSAAAPAPAGTGTGAGVGGGAQGGGAPLSCEPCEKEFTSETARQAHLQSHVLCPEKGCGFSALRKVVNNHHEAKHGQFNGSGFQVSWRLQA